jgi:hypothetical protein
MIMALTIQQGIDALSTRISSKNEGSYQGGENMYLVFTQDIRQQRTICSLPFLSPQDAMTVYNKIREKFPLLGTRHSFGNIEKIVEDNERAQVEGSVWLMLYENTGDY